jgi:hypothetical protein
MSRSGLSGTNVLFLGWFGPRGLASVVFALLAIEELGLSEEPVAKAVAVVVLTVLLSVILHGITAGSRFGDPSQDTTQSDASLDTRPGGIRHLGLGSKD